MRRRFALILAVLLVLTVSACQTQPGDQGTTLSPTTEATELATEPATEPAEAPTELATEPTEAPTEPATEPTTEPTAEPTEEPTQPHTEPAVQPSGYKYDFGTVIENPTDADFESFYTMVKRMNDIWPGDSFTTDTLTYRQASYLILNDEGCGMFDQFDFSFESESILMVESDEMTQFSRYYAADVDWVMMAVFGLEPDHNADIGAGYDQYREWYDRYFEGEYFYRFAGENYKGNPGTSTEVFEPRYEALGDGSYKFSINITTQFEFSDEPAVYYWEFVAIPMNSKDCGIYWKILSFMDIPTE